MGRRFITAHDVDDLAATGSRELRLDAGTSRRQLRSAVRQGVVEEFGGAPDGLDAAIGRVFDRLGIRD